MKPCYLPWLLAFAFCQPSYAAVILYKEILERADRIEVVSLTHSELYFSGESLKPFRKILLEEFKDRIRSRKPKNLPTKAMWSKYFIRIEVNIEGKFKRIASFALEESDLANGSDSWKRIDQFLVGEFKKRGVVP